MLGQQAVLVTGGASGIGRAIVDALLLAGHRAIVADQSRGNLERCRETLNANADRVRIEPLDVSDEAEVVRSIAACEDEFGPIAGVVNSAGIGRDVPSLDTSADLFRKILEVNLIGSFLVSREVAKRMVGRKAGSIVNIASVSGILGNEGRVAYGASKGGVITMTRVMAVELASRGVRVNAIAPGPVETPMVEAVHTPQARRSWLSTIPQRRYGQPSDIASVALFLLDERKSGFITGQTICVDGGFTVAGIMTGGSRDAHP